MSRGIWQAAAMGAALACAGSALAEGGVRLLTGALQPLGPPVPAGALVVVEAVDPEGRPFAEATLRLRETAPPFGFAIGVPSGSAVELRAAIFVDGAPGWAVAGLAVPAGAETLPADVIEVAPFVPVGPEIPLRCAGTPLSVGYYGDRALLVAGERRIVMGVAERSPATRYETADGATVLTRRGNRVDVTLDGRDLPECALVPPAETGPYRAGGSEPGWSATLSSGRLAVSLEGGGLTRDAPVVSSALDGDTYVYTSAGAGELGIRPGLCRDTMSGMPFPDTARLTTDGRTYSGCGGDPRDLLAGGTWTVVSIDGVPPQAEAPVTLDFGDDGALGGSAGCNRYLTGFEITGETAQVTRLAATRRACAEPDMATEEAFLRALAAVRRFDFDDSGALQLLDPGAERPAIVARR